MAIPLKFSILLIIILAFEARETKATMINKVQAPTLPILHLRHVTVSIINKVKAPTPTILTLHCKSKDDDLEEQTIHYKKQV